MTEKIIIAGAGGQGVMLLGKVLAQAAMRENKQVTWIPAYGAEVRGGTAYCMVIVSDDEISSPYVDKADTLMIMNAPALERFGRQIKTGGLMIINASLATEDVKKTGITRVRHPFTDIAITLGNAKVANMVALGCYLANKGIINADSVIGAMRDIAPKGSEEILAVNIKALLKGKELK